MPININDTRTMLAAIERGFKPSSLLVDTFFPVKQNFMTEYVDIEFKKGGRKMAPFIVPGSKGVNSARTGSTVQTYKAPIIKPKRNITVSDVETRGFGENVYSQLSPEDRAMQLRAKDLLELQDEIARRKEWMAAQLLLNGSYTIEGYADDGKNVVVDTVNFGWNGKTILSGSDTWDNASAKIYDNIGDVSVNIRKNAGVIPTVAICSENVVKFMLANKQLTDLMMIPSRDNLALLSMQPKIQSPEVIRVGYIQAFNMEVYSYVGSYVDANGALQQYIPDNNIIIGVPGRGKQLFGAVTQIESDKAMHTYAAEFVPKVTIDEENDVSTLAVSSRPVLAPEFVEDWAVIKVK